MHSNFVLHLPNEILAIIINELALVDNEDIDNYIDNYNDNDNDKNLKALASCRLASHVLCSLATPLLFSSISLTDVRNDGFLWFYYGMDRAQAWGTSLFVERATELNDILATGNIAASIHSLRVTLDHSQTLEDSSSGAIMSAILPRLPHIENFSLYTYSRASFCLLPMDFAAAIEALCRSRNLTTLYLDGIADFPFTTIRTCPNLRCLRLWRSPLAFVNVNSRDEISSSQLLHLESLEVDCEVIKPLRSHISKDVSIGKLFSRLKNLHFTYGLSDASGWDVILLASQTLQKLELTVDRLFKDMANVPFDLGRFPALRYIKIEHRCWDPKFIRFLTRLLSIPSSPSGIEVLEITMAWRDVEDGHGKDLFSSDAGWSKLDKLFTSERFVSLRKVVLRLELHMAGDDPRHILDLERNLTLPYVHDLFPSFRASNTQRTVEIHLEVPTAY